MTEEFPRVRIDGVREKEVSGQEAERLSKYIGRYGLVASWVMRDNIEVPLIILDDGEVIYGSQVWWQRL